MRGLNQDHPLLLPTILEHAAMNFGETEIVSYGRDEAVRTTYAATAVRARRLASSLIRLGLKQGDIAGSLAWNSHRHLELFYGMSGIGAVLHTANPRLPLDHLAYCINFAGYRVLFVDPETAPLLAQLRDRLTTVETIVAMGDDSSVPEALRYEDLIDAGDADFAWPSFDERLACLLCFTSGTTGAPKGVLYNHRGTILSAMSTGAGNGWGLSANDAIVAIPGFFHCNGWATPFFGPMFGAKIVIPGRRMETEWLHRLIVDEGVTVGPGVPTIWLSLLDYCRKQGVGLGRLDRIYSGGTAPPLPMMEAYLRDYGVRTIHGWGMTETTSGSTMSFAPRHLETDAALAQMRMQGKPLYGNEIRIVGETGEVLPRDGAAAGHLQARGHWVAGGYFRRDDVELQTVDGWMQTGDIATIDPDNTLHIVDRAKEMIKSGGEWISSTALEEAAMSHPAVRTAAVIAMDHPVWQERPMLVLIARREVAEDEIRTHLAGLVPKWWLPDAIVFTTELPFGPTGKLAKGELRQWIASGKIDSGKIASGKIAR